MCWIHSSWDLGYISIYVISLYLCFISISMLYVSLADQWLVHLEEGFGKEVCDELRRRGHQVNWPITGTLSNIPHYKIHNLGIISSILHLSINTTCIKLVFAKERIQ